MFDDDGRLVAYTVRYRYSQLQLARKVTIYIYLHCMHRLIQAKIIQYEKLTGIVNCKSTCI